MVVRRVPIALVMIATGHGLSAGLGHAERARHAEMHEQDLARVEIGEQVFGAAAEPGDGAALEPRREIPGQRPAQVAAARLDLVETRAVHHRLESATHRLDLGKLGHALTLRAIGRSFASFRV